MTPEGRLKYDCHGIARINSLAFWNIEGKGIRGIPDTLAEHLDGRGFVLIEFKTPDGVLSEQQERRLQRLRQGGQRCCVCRSIEDYRRAVGLLNDQL